MKPHIHFNLFFYSIWFAVKSSHSIGLRKGLRDFWRLNMINCSVLLYSFSFQPYRALLVKFLRWKESKDTALGLRGFCEVLLPRRCSSSFLPQLISELHPTPRTNTLIEICPFHIRAMASLCLSPTAAVTLIIRPPSWINLESF